MRINKLLNYLLSEQKEEESKEEDNLNSDLPLGKYVFADPRADIRKDDKVEKNTPLEGDLFHSLGLWFDDSDESRLKNQIPILKQLASSSVDEYEKIFSPPKSGFVYRGIKVYLGEAAKIIDVSAETILKDISNKHGQVTYNKKIILNHRNPGEQIQSWTVNPGQSMIFAGLSIPTFTAPDYKPSAPDLKLGLISLMFKAKLSNKNNTFFLNPNEMEKTFKQASIFYFIDEEEVISCGPVECESVTVVYSRNNMDKKQAEKYHKHIKASIK